MRAVAGCMESLRRLGRRALGGLPPAFLCLFAATLVNRLGSFVVPFLALYLTDARGLSAADAGVILAFYGGGAIACQPLGGILADRFDTLIAFGASPRATLFLVPTMFSVVHARDRNRMDAMAVHTHPTQA